MEILRGNPISPGVALGAVYLYTPAACIASEAFCKAGAEAAELARYKAAVAGAAAELEELISRSSGEQAEIFFAHREILQDEEISGMVRNGILHLHQDAAWAAYKAYAEFIATVEKAPDALIAARAADLRDVRSRLLRVMRGEAQQNLSALPGPCVVVAKDLPPSDTATLERANVLGIITEEGGVTSHTAIIAGSYRIPAVAGVAGCTARLFAGAYVGLNALTGEVFLQPDAGTKAALLKAQAAYLRKKALADEYLDRPAQTADGVSYEIGINIGGDIPPGSFKYCDFVGLFRTEFLYMRAGRLPSEEEQYGAYCDVIRAASGRVVTLRTLDIGGDKTLPYMRLPAEQNPFLGLRALRLCLMRPQLLCIQMRAALRAASLGPLWVMLPMVGCIEDIRAGRAALQSARAGLEAENIPFGDVKLGIMIEVPAIASVAEFAAAEVDFASIGTNDLCQYLCAADRMNPAVAGWYQMFSPAMARSLGAVIAAFNRAGKPVSACGEMAGDARGALLLYGLGLRKLSMNPAKIAGVKAALGRVSTQTAAETAQKAKNVFTQAEVLELLETVLDN